MTTLPKGYKAMDRIELLKDEKLMTRLGVLSLVVAAVAVVIGLFIAPFRVILTFGSLPLLTTPLILLLVYVLFILIHELIHGVTMKMYCDAKVSYGFRLTYAYAASEGYFTKRQHMTIGLAPVVIIGVFLLLLAIILPMGWFWNIHVLQVFNLSSAVGDFYMAYKLRKEPEDMLIQDDGPAMTIFHRVETEPN